MLHVYLIPVTPLHRPQGLGGVLNQAGDVDGRAHVHKELGLAHNTGHRHWKEGDIKSRTELRERERKEGRLVQAISVGLKYDHCFNIGQVELVSELSESLGLDTISFSHCTGLVKAKLPLRSMAWKVSGGAGIKKKGARCQASTLIPFASG